MNPETIQRIEDLLAQEFPTPRTWEWLAAHLEKEVKKNEKSRSRYKEYFQKNKEKLYEYHKQYRINHPDYENARRKNARQRIKK